MRRNINRILAIIYLISLLPLMALYGNILAAQLNLDKDTILMIATWLSIFTIIVIEKIIEKIWKE